MLAGDGPVTEVDETTWKRSFDVNVTGAFLMAKHAVPVIAASGGGSIIHIASVLAHVGAAGRAAYCAQKGALLMMTKAMAVDHGKDNIRVNSLSPGPIATERYMKKFGLHNTANSPRAHATPCLAGLESRAKSPMRRSFSPPTPVRSSPARTCLSMGASVQDKDACDVCVIGGGGGAEVRSSD